MNACGTVMKNKDNATVANAVLHHSCECGIWTHTCAHMIGLSASSSGDQAHQSVVPMAVVEIKRIVQIAMADGGAKPWVVEDVTAMERVLIDGIELGLVAMIQLWPWARSCTTPTLQWRSGQPSPFPFS